SKPTNAVLGALSSATLLIIDDDPPPASFASGSFLVNEAAGSIAIPIRLNTPFSQTVFVDYATSDGTAKAGSDYITASGPRIFAPGETNKSFVLTILNNAVQEPDETVHLSITGMVNATPGLFTSATLTITESVRLGAPGWGTNGFHATLIGPP